MTTSVVRQDEQFHAPARAVVPIAEEVFGLRRGSGGPLWILDPPAEVRRLFWEKVGARIEPQQEVFVAEGAVLLEAVLDLHDHVPPGFEGRTGLAWLFFIDLVPPANWSHPCAYVVVRLEEEPLWLEHRWPPSEAIRLVPLPRPPSAR
jgi:hypothetical protein